MHCESSTCSLGNGLYPWQHVCLTYCSLCSRESDKRHDVVRRMLSFPCIIPVTGMDSMRKRGMRKWFHNSCIVNEAVHVHACLPISSRNATHSIYRVHASIPVSMLDICNHEQKMTWDKSKNPWSWENRTFPYSRRFGKCGIYPWPGVLVILFHD